MDLITPGSGLVIWQILGFGFLLVILLVFAWKPILVALDARELHIEGALKAAELAKSEMANLKAENEKLLQEARIERDQILKTAHEASIKIVEDAKSAATKEGQKLIESAKAVIDNEKKAALNEVKNQVAVLTLELTEKLIKKNLSTDSAQKELVDQMVKELKYN
jgi:F-type H+-transporting ATPase subunit b